jgi:pimeloyl-ACP methyl ester carboxylesterase
MPDSARRRARTCGRGFAILALALSGLSAGCLQPMPDRAERLPRGCVYYFDGAGGGGIRNWAGGVRQGLLDAGYRGAGELVSWNTGFGVMADQDSSIDYKRGKAAEAAQNIQQYAKQYPGAPVTVIGLSAGTAVAVFTLEALPANCPVENVILLGASISNDYDLTQALRRVRGRLYVFTSEHDAVLAFAVTAAGTADRKMGSISAGLHGFEMPARPTAETRGQYSKVVNIQWKPEFMEAGNFGGHTDSVKAPFVQQHLAPLIMAGMARSAPAAPAAGRIRNPDYERWARCNPGAWVTFEGYQIVGGARQPLRMTARLVSKHENRLLVERTYAPVGGGNDALARVQQFMVESMIAPAAHPLTTSAARITDLPDETITITGRPFPCRMRQVSAAGEFPEYGRGVWAALGQNDTIPGGLARVWLRSSKGNQPFEFYGQVVDYGTR